MPTPPPSRESRVVSTLRSLFWDAAGSEAVDLIGAVAAHRARRVARPWGPAVDALLAPASRLAELADAVAVQVDALDPEAYGSAAPGPMDVVLTVRPEHVTPVVRAVRSNRQLRLSALIVYAQGSPTALAADLRAVAAASPGCDVTIALPPDDFLRAADMPAAFGLRTGLGDGGPEGTPWPVTALAEALCRAAGRGLPVVLLDHPTRRMVGERPHATPTLLGAALAAHVGARPDEVALLLDGPGDARTTAELLRVADRRRSFRGFLTRCVLHDPGPVGHFLGRAAALL